MDLKETQPDNSFRAISERRLANDFAKLQEDPIPGISAGPRGDNLRLWDCVMLGPPGTPWEEGVFQLIVHVPPDYPFWGPRILFQSRVFHPNVFPDGSVCIDGYKPAMSMGQLLLFIQSLLDDPGLESPANPEAARLYSTDRRKYNRKVQEICAATHERTKLYPVTDVLIGFDDSSKQAEPSVARDDSGSTSSVIRTDDIGSTSLAVAEMVQDLQLS